MTKLLFIMVFAFSLTALLSFSAYAFTCKVKSVEGTTVNLECREKYAKKLTVGSKTKIIAQKRRAIEGC